MQLPKLLDSPYRLAWSNLFIRIDRFFFHLNIILYPPFLWNILNFILKEITSHCFFSHSFTRTIRSWYRTREKGEKTVFLSHLSPTNHPSFPLTPQQNSISHHTPRLFSLSLSLAFVYCNRYNRNQWPWQVLQEKKSDEKSDGTKKERKTFFSLLKTKDKKKKTHLIK